MIPEVCFGNAEYKPKDWRAEPLVEEPDDDELLPETPADVIAALGFDPLEPEEEEDELGKGDVEGHPFRGNQYTDVAGTGSVDELDSKAVPVTWDSPTAEQVTESISRASHGEGPVLIGPSAEAKRAIDYDVKELLSGWARDHNMSVDEFEAKTLDDVKKVLAKAVVCTRVPGDATLRDILGSGRLKSQFETGTSEGYLNPQMRTGVETTHYLYPEDTPATLRPIYGYLRDEDDSDGPRGAHHYGPIEIVFDSAIKDRTTWTRNDSLDYESLMYPTPVNNPGTGSFGGGGLFGVHTVSHMCPTGGYIEAQMHGRVTLADIKVVRFKNRVPPHPDTVKLLTEKGIKWEVTD